MKTYFLQKFEIQNQIKLYIQTNNNNYNYFVVTQKYIVRGNF